MSITGIANKTKLTLMALAAAMILLPAGSAYAATETLTFTGDASGNIVGPNALSSSTFSDQAFTLTFTADPATITQSGGYDYLSDVDGTFTEGTQTLTLTNVTVEVNSNSGYENVDFYNSSFFNGLGLANNLALLDYGLTTDVDTGLVLASSGNLTPTFGGGSFSTTGTDVVEFTGDSSLEFAVTGAAVTPEPSSILLMLTGLFGGALLLRRRITA
jgi:hypothetical protein